MSRSDELGLYNEHIKLWVYRYRKGANICTVNISVEDNKTTVTYTIDKKELANLVKHLQDTLKDLPE